MVTDTLPMRSTLAAAGVITDCRCETHTGCSWRVVRSPAIIPTAAPITENRGRPRSQLARWELLDGTVLGYATGHATTADCSLTECVLMFSDIPPCSSLTKYCPGSLHANTYQSTPWHWSGAKWSWCSPRSDLENVRSPYRRQVLRVKPCRNSIPPASHPKHGTETPRRAAGTATGYSTNWR